MKNTTFIVIASVAIGFLLYLNFYSGKMKQPVSSVVFTPKAPKPSSPYSQGILTGNTLFVAGQVGINPATSQLDSSSFENELRQAMANVGAILEAAKMDYSHVVKTTVYLTDVKNFSRLNAVYAPYFPNNPPARETVGVAALPKGAHVEVSVIAVR